jgi:hypothetical protein
MPLDLMEHRPFPKGHIISATTINNKVIPDVRLGKSPRWLSHRGALAVTR